MKNARLYGQRLTEALEKASSKMSLLEAVELHSLLKQGLDTFANRLASTRTFSKWFKHDDQTIFRLRSVVTSRLETLGRRHVYEWLGKSQGWLADEAVTKMFQHHTTKWCNQNTERDKIRSSVYRLMVDTPIISKQLVGAASCQSLHEIAHEVRSLILEHGQLFPWEIKAKLDTCYNHLLEARDWDVKYQLTDHAQIINRPSNPNGRLADLCYEIRKSIRNLDEGKTALIPLGTRGHALLAEVQRTSETHYRFALVNTGDGSYELARRAGFNNNQTRGKIPEVAITDLSLDEVTNPRFWDEALRIRCLSNKDYKADDLNTAVIEHLCRGRISRLQLGIPLPKQLNGFCTRASGMAWLRKTLDNTVLFQCFQLYTCAKALASLQKYRRQPHLIPELSATISGQELKGSALIEKIHQVGTDRLARLSNQLRITCNRTLDSWTAWTEECASSLHLADTLLRELSPSWIEETPHYSYSS